MVRYGDILKNQRQGLRISVAEIASGANVSPSTIREIEVGDIVASCAVKRDIARAFKEITKQRKAEAKKQKKLPFKVEVGSVPVPIISKDRVKHKKHDK